MQEDLPTQKWPRRRYQENSWNERHCNSFDRVHNHKNGLIGLIEDAGEKHGDAQIEHCNTAGTGQPSLQKHGKAMNNNMTVTHANVAGTNRTNEQHYNICEKTYKYKSSLVRHIKKVHEKETNVKHKLQTPRPMETPSLKEQPKVNHTN